MYDLLLTLSALASELAEVTRPATRAERSEANRLVHALGQVTGIAFPAWGAYADALGVSTRSAAGLVSYLDDVWVRTYDVAEPHCAGGCGMLMDVAGARCVACAVADLDALLVAPQADAPARKMPARDASGRFLPARTYTMADFDRVG
jgi:hypothetical protein